ncbi:MAG: NADH-quinone oxidoreductase subunit B [Bdellovibrionaceae bacterium]|nr:NADH-quinone oxidoreductase subunit B [Pseudobdellovibrionaceae bacterium]|tara:strand:- start:5979 stop:6500 length:522 start_codon:yes stop_codon:yes gene_type:complete
MSKDGSSEYVTTKLDVLVNWARKNALWPLPFGTSCCGIEMMATLCSDYDMARFGAEVVRFSPRQSDVLLVAGIINAKMAPVIKNIYEQMAEPKWVISMGACASSGGIFNVYSVTQGVDTILPVDVYIPGCPPTPEAVMHGLLRLQRMVESGDTRSQRAAKKNVATNSLEGEQA